ncbi:hypothetical protein [Desulforamulus ruminis]|uniref:hypothetical protein n=1 Tax=Desulforamulus ruminis TaxID=1564 RepID=UPI0002DAB76A|nr:hypothetical protein [Desulforamulus ruminis]
MLEKQTSNYYIIQEEGKNFIYPTPWYQEGIFMGITEMVLKFLRRSLILFVNKPIIRGRFGGAMAEAKIGMQFFTVLMFNNH